MNIFSRPPGRQQGAAGLEERFRKDPGRGPGRGGGEQTYRGEELKETGRTEELGRWESLDGLQPLKP